MPPQGQLAEVALAAVSVGGQLSLCSHELKQFLSCSDTSLHSVTSNLLPLTSGRHLVLTRKVSTAEEWKRKVKGAHQFLLVGSLLGGMLVLSDHQLLVQVTDNERRVIPVPQHLVHICLDLAEHLNTFVSYETLLDFFVK